MTAILQTAFSIAGSNFTLVRSRCSIYYLVIIGASPAQNQTTDIDFHWRNKWIWDRFPMFIKMAWDYPADWCSPSTLPGSAWWRLKWKHFPRYWPFVWGIHRSPVNSLHKRQWSGALIFPLRSITRLGEALSFEIYPIIVYKYCDITKSL